MSEDWLCSQDAMTSSYKCFTGWEHCSWITDAEVYSWLTVTCVLVSQRC